VTVPAAQNEIDVAGAAGRFVDARRQARALPGFPGPVPSDLATGYAIQDVAIGLWPDEIAGWKLGKINPPDDTRLGAGRVAGPIFARNVWPASAAATVLPAIPGGFAAIEGEFVLRLGDDAPARSGWTPETAAGLVDAMFIGAEFAGSPLATINILGPTVVASDFGNNAGLILGPPIADWRSLAPESLSVTTRIDGEVVGRGTGADIPGGPLASVAFLLNLAAERGLRLRKGALISTGAVTGVHDIRIGQSAAIDFGPYGDLHCQVAEATPSP
jgi:2-keto-4-pentenoate hydratase